MSVSQGRPRATEDTASAAQTARVTRRRLDIGFLVDGVDPGGDLDRAGARQDLGDPSFRVGRRVEEDDAELVVGVARVLQRGIEEEPREPRVEDEPREREERAEEDGALE